MSWYPPQNQPPQQGGYPPQNGYPQPQFTPAPIIKVKEAPLVVSKKAWGIKEAALSIAAEILLLLLILPVVEGAINAGNLPLAIYATLIGQFGGMYAVWMGFMIYSSYFKGQKSWPRDFGFKFKWYDIFIGLGLGLITLTTQNIIIAGMSILNSATATDLVSTTPTVLAATQPAVPYWYSILFGIILPVLCAPFFEELYFRGFIMGSMIRFFKRFTDTPKLQWMNKFKYLFAATFSSVVFGMIHIQDYHTQGDWMTPILTGSTGFVLAWAAILFKRLGPGMMGHATHNAFITINTMM